MPEVHFSVLVVKDSILYDLPHIKGDVLNNRIVQQGALASHFAYVGSRNEVGSDEMVPLFGDIGQVLGHEMHRMPLTVGFPLTWTIGEQSKYFGVVRVFSKSIVCFVTNWFQVIKLVDRPCVEIYKTCPSPVLVSPRVNISWRRILGQPLW